MAQYLIPAPPAAFVYTTEQTIAAVRAGVNLEQTPISVLEDAERAWSVAQATGDIDAAAAAAWFVGTMNGRGVGTGRS